MMILPSLLALCTSPASCPEARVVGGCTRAARRLPSPPCSAHRARAACLVRSLGGPLGSVAHVLGPLAAPLGCRQHRDLGSRATCIFAFTVPPRLLFSEAGWPRLASAGPGSPPGGGQWSHAVSTHRLHPSALRTPCGDGAKHPCCLLPLLGPPAFACALHQGFQGSLALEHWSVGPTTRGHTHRLWGQTSWV